MRSVISQWFLLTSFLGVGSIAAITAQEIGFDKLTLSEEFHSEGIAIADIDKDGNTDVISGPFWYRGPDFKQRIRYTSGESLPIVGYSHHFFTWANDFNEDGHIDILTVGMPGTAAYWFQNPGKSPLTSQQWVKRKAYEEISNESPELIDIVGDSRPELVCIHQGAYAYIEYKIENGVVTFAHTPITRNLGYGRFTHGMGVADVDGDGKNDLLETNGWWQQQDPNELFKFHPYRFAQSGGAQMFAYDFDGDGDNDVICSQNAHSYGLKWFEQVKSDGKIDFIARTIMTDKPQDHPLGLAVSQLHAAALQDIDGDGINDFVTGKRFWAHGGHDPGSKQLPLLFWLKTIRKQGRVIFEPKLIDIRAGVGTQLSIGDINHDGQPDIAMASKLGTYVFLQNKQTKPLAWEDQPLSAGTQLFYENVRSTEPLSPADQLKTFVLPQGFEIQLVAAEPDIAKPMNMAFDQQGRLWVSSSLEYPFAAKSGTKARDAIKILHDTNGDGRADQVKTFADGLNIPMGLLPYGDGVICFSIPHIWYLRDTDGDDQVDKREILYGPFDTSRDTHGMCSSFTLGNDGWIYACHGFNNQSKVKGRDGHEITLNSGNVFRFKPDGSRIEVVSHGQVNPFGMTIDSMGDILTADCHTKPINLVLPGGHHDSFGKPHDGLGYIPNVMEHLHDSTGIGGIALGEYTAFPQVYQRSTFGGNVVTGRINRNHLVYSGSSLTAREEADFLIPGDPWFRPVNLQVGPQGTLYIADFYNRIIGHYEVDLNHPGRDRHRGRIWKIVYKGNPGRRDRAVVKTATRSKIPDEPIAQLKRLQTANRTEANAVIARVLDESVKDAKYLDQFLAQAKSLAHEDFREASYWLAVLLKRTQRVDTRQLFELAKIDSVRTRSLAFQLLKDYPTQSFQPRELKLLLQSGLQDDSPFVRRFAAIATSQHSKIDLAADLVSRLADARTANDRFQVHAIKIALREQFAADPDRLLAAVQKLSPTCFGDFADVCMTTQSANAARFIVKHLESLAVQNPEKLAPYLEFSAKFADVESIDAIVKIASTRFAADRDFQLAILNSLQTGLRQRGRAMPNSMRRLATQIANQLMRLPSLNWALQAPTGQSPFSTRRVKVAGGGETLMIDTLSRGESSTGIARSQPFLLKKSFVFHLAGHHAQTSDPAKQNFVRLILVDGDKVIERAPVPGSDLAQRISWDTKKHQGQRAVLEIVDQADTKSYAWIAVGKFDSQPSLNPEPHWHIEPESDALQWSCFSSENSTAVASGENIFEATRRRTSADGMKNTPLWSSIVKGEQRTGVFRSEPFTIGATFHFFLAGHDGYPDKPANKLNYVQLRLADTGLVIQKAYPPRNDTAQPISWDTSKWSGKKTYLELVDRDTAGAFAWLAAGRFSLTELNPTERNGDRQLAAKLISQFQLEECKDDILRLLDLTKNHQLKSELCHCLLSLESKQMKPTAILQTTADLLKLSKLDEERSRAAVSAVRTLNDDLARQTIRQAMQQMSTAEQSQIAQQLSRDRAGAVFILQLVDSGAMSKTVFRNPTTVEKIKINSTSEVSQQVNSILSQMDKVDPELEKRIAEQKSAYTDAKLDLTNGRKVFEKNCSNCHRLGQMGNQVGPNLDGIGNRGVDRLVDDILLPNRNVDIAFRASIIATIDGRVINGFVKPDTTDSNSSISVVDPQGKTTLVRRGDIEKIKQTRNSPMPANFGESISKQDFSDLLAYLLSNPK